MFISVDLPAPFSPSRQWISPCSIVSVMSSLATKEPNLLVRPRISSSMDNPSSDAEHAHLARTTLDVRRGGGRLPPPRRPFNLYRWASQPSLSSPELS